MDDAILKRVEKRIFDLFMKTAKPLNLKEQKEYNEKRNQNDMTGDELIDRLKREVYEHLLSDFGLSLDGSDDDEMIEIDF